MPDEDSKCLICLSWRDFVKPFSEHWIDWQTKSNNSRIYYEKVSDRCEEKAWNTRSFIQEYLSAWDSTKSVVSFWGEGWLCNIDLAGNRCWLLLSVVKRFMSHSLSLFPVPDWPAAHSPHRHHSHLYLLPFTWLPQWCEAFQYRHGHLQPPPQTCVLLFGVSNVSGAWRRVHL